MHAGTGKRAASAQKNSTRENPVFNDKDIMPHTAALEDTVLYQTSGMDTD